MKKKSAGNCPSAILKTVPNSYEKINFIQLNSDEDFSNKAIIGKIILVNPVGRRANGYIRKLLVIDALEEPKEDQKKLTVFLLDQFAQDSEAAEVEGYIIIANLFVEKSTHPKENEFTFQILVKHDDSQVWFGRKVVSTLERKRNKIKNSKKYNDEDIQGEPEPTILSNHYDYVPLGELRETEPKETFNIYGIVEKCDLKITQGKRIQVLDLSLTDKTETGFTCSIFSAKDEIFPDIYPGDIIRIHRMLVNKFRNKLKGKCLSSRFILVFSKSNGGAKPRTTAKSFTFTHEDALIVRDLFEWYDVKNQPKFISEIKKGDFVNIICQVIGVYIAKNSDTVILKIWDGTKSNLLEGRHLGLRDEKMDEKLFAIAKNYYVVLFVYGQHCTFAGELEPGQFIEICDAHLYSPKDNPDDCKLCLPSGNKDKRGIQILKLDDNRLIELKERFGKIITEAQELGNLTEDILSEDNSIFLNCDISVLPASQKSCRTQEESANIEILNKPLPSLGERTLQSQVPKVISVIDAAVKPGQSTQEFGETLQRDYLQIDQTQETGLSFLSDPFLNKTPFEFRMGLHNPSSQTNFNSAPPFTNDTPEEWWSSLSTVSETDGHFDVKPSSLAEVVKHEVPYKFRTMCAVLSYKPNISSICQLIHLYCPVCQFITEDLQPVIEPFKEQDGIFYFFCPDCSKKNDKKNRPLLKYIYVFSLDLHDGTGPASLEVYVWGENAVKFLKNILPEQVLRDKESADSVLQMLWSICPNSRPFNSSENISNNYNTYPILDCCILSYTISNQTFYQLFDTKLI